MLELITRTLRTIYVEREDPESRMKAAEEIRRRTHTRGEWPKVLIFPEGKLKKLIVPYFRTIIILYWEIIIRSSLQSCINLYLYIDLGTTTNRKAIISFKQGPFLSRLPVQPVLMKFKNRMVTNNMYYYYACMHINIIVSQNNLNFILLLRVLLGPMKTGDCKFSCHGP